MHASENRGGSDVTEDEEHDQIIDAIRRLNPQQRAVILGTIATLQIFDDDEAAARWVARNRDAIKTRIKDAQ
jgi:hypothetical protein